MTFTSFDEASHYAKDLAEKLGRPIRVYQSREGWVVAPLPTPEWKSKESCLPVADMDAPQESSFPDIFDDEPLWTGPKREFWEESKALQSKILFYKDAAAAGDAHAALALGKIYLERQDFNLALLSFKAASDKLPEACKQIAEMYDFGWGVRSDEVDRLIWLEKAAEMGDVEAMLMAADWHLETQDQYAVRERGLELLKHAADLGSAEAIRILFSSNEKGT